MALNDENGINVSMPVAPMGGYGGGWGYPVMAYGNNGGFGNDFMGYFLMLFLFAAMGGGFGGFGGFGGWGGGFGNEIAFPWLLNGQNGINANTNAGFNQAATSAALGNVQNAITSGFGDVQLGLSGVNNAICQSGNQNNAAVVGAQNAITQQMYNNEINSLNRSFAEQTANAQSFNAMQGQLAQCCCDNRLATVQTQNIVQAEAAANRASNTANTQAILDKLCQIELDTVKNELSAAHRENNALQTQLTVSATRADNAEQTARLLADNAAQTQLLQNYLRQQANSCAGYSPCGCGSGVAGFNGAY